MDKLNILYVMLFTTEGGTSKNSVDIGMLLAQECNLFCVVGNCNIESSIINEKARLVLNINKNNYLSYFSLKNARAIKKFAKDNTIDCVLYMTDSIANILLMVKLDDYKQIVYLHNPEPHAGTPFLIAIFQRLSNIVATRLSDKIIVASKLQKVEMMAGKKYHRVINKIEVVYLGAQSQMLFDLPKVDEDIDVLFFGRIEYYKGLDVLIKAMSMPNMHNKSCFIIGRGNVENAINGLEIPKNVKIINKYLPDKEIAEFINRCKVFVLPYREATGTQIAQTAMYYRKPIIATDVGCLSEYIVDGVNGLVVEAGSPEKLNAAIEKVLYNQMLKEMFAEHAKDTLDQKFNNQVIVKSYMKLIKECVYE